MRKQKLRLAILDMNAGQANQGMRCIREIVQTYKEVIEAEEFDVRVSDEVPDTSFDIYISSGGPGNPLEGNGIWDVRFFDLIDELLLHNQNPQNKRKFFFFICHSFQLACNHFQLGDITKRKSTSFGIMPIHKTQAGVYDPVMAALNDPFHAVDSRDWQLVQPNLEKFEEYGATILSLEKIRTYVEYERAIMAVRFSPEFVGTQFHPEADADGMLRHIQKKENREKIVKNYGEEKFNDMVEKLHDPDKINMTHRTILPNFIDGAINVLTQEEALVF